MAEQSWFNAEANGSETSSSFFAQNPLAQAAPPPRRSTYELRPLTTGEVLDRTFFLYRNNFWLFVGISAVAASVSVITAIAQQLYLHFSKIGTDVKAAPGDAMAHLGALFGMGLIAGLLYLVVYSVTQAATVSAVTSIYLGDPTSMRQAFKAVTGRWYRYLAIALWQAWSGMWLYVVLVAPAFAGIAFLGRRGAGASGGAGLGGMAGLGLLLIVGSLGGVVYGVIAYIRNSLAVPSEVMEGLTIRAAMKRSKRLAAGTKGRIFLLFLLLVAMTLVLYGIQVPFVMIAAKTKGAQVVLLQAIMLFINFVVTSLVGPIGAIGLCLFYIDQRVRKEGFDIEYLIERSAPAAGEALPVPYPIENP